MTRHADITGLVLAGGRGSRMGHVDKGLQTLHGEAMAAHVLRRLAPQVGQIAINANRNLDAYAALGAPVWPDDLAGFEGPLAGLATGLRRCTTALLLTAPCDCPFLPHDLAERLHAALIEQGADLALAETPEPDAQPGVQLQPVFALVQRHAQGALAVYLASGGRRMDGWYTGLKAVRVRFDDRAAFQNINTLQELAQHEDTPRSMPCLTPCLTHVIPHAMTPNSLQQIATALPHYDPDALSVRDAQRIIGQFITPVLAVEQVALRTALDRVLADDIISPINVPVHDNSAMDGYALNGADLPAEGEAVLKVVGTAYAGRASNVLPQRGECLRIMTGAVMPEGTDSVIPQELVAHATQDAITVPAGAIRAGDNRRLAGEDLMAGSAALRRGRVIRPADLGLLASLGIAEVPVRRRLRVAFFSTGDELRSIGQPLDAGCVYDSNRYTLYGMLLRLGCDVIDMGVVPDRPDALEAALRSACENADAVLTSGGVSVGAADYTRAIMARLGEVAFWKLAMRPGRPLAFGRIASNGRSAYLFGLPGNPVAVMVSFYFFARDALLGMMGAHAPLPRLRARAGAPIRKKPGRTEYQRAILETADDGTALVRITGAQGSGILSSMTQANCMVVLHDEQGDVAQGEWVDVVMFEGLV